jgi:uncharacterized protein YgbK (DUF1537 family)
MSLPEDIETRLTRDYGSEMAVAREQVEEYLEKQEHEPVRTARCAIHLASGSLEELDRMLDAGIRDYRDVILWAEYDKGKEPPVRDFNVPFDETT